MQLMILWNVSWKHKMENFYQNHEIDDPNDDSEETLRLYQIIHVHVTKPTTVSFDVKHKHARNMTWQ